MPLHPSAEGGWMAEEPEERTEAAALPVAAYSRANCAMREVRRYSLGMNPF